MALSPMSIFRGTDAEMYLEGNWLTNVSEVDANVAINQADVNLLGQYWTHTRNMGLKGTGSMKGVFVSTDLIEKISTIQNGVEFRTELVVKNTNPDTGATYRVRLMNVIFNAIPLGTFQAGQVASQDFSFAFSGFEILDSVASIS